MNYAIDLRPFYGNGATTKPVLLQGAIVVIGEDRFTVDKWNLGEQYCYVFSEIGKNGKWKPFAKSPEDVEKGILANKITVEKKSL